MPTCPPRRDIAGAHATPDGAAPRARPPAPASCPAGLSAGTSHSGSDGERASGLRLKVPPNGRAHAGRHGARAWWAPVLSQPQPRPPPARPPMPPLRDTANLLPQRPHDSWNQMRAPLRGPAPLAQTHVSGPVRPRPHRATESHPSLSRACLPPSRDKLSAGRQVGPCHHQRPPAEPGEKRSSAVPTTPRWRA